VAMTMPILVGTDGTRRMGKSLGNYIGVAEDPVTQFAKVMSIPDEPMRQYFTLLTDLPLTEVDALLGPAINPRDAKEELGKAIVTQYAGPEAAKHAAAEFRRRASGEDPDAIPEIKIAAPFGFTRALARLLVDDLGFDSSTSNTRRMIQQGGVTIGAARFVVQAPNAVVQPRSDRGCIELDEKEHDRKTEFSWDDFVIRYGKRKIARVHFLP
jgi:tyrosyl-tRNA synthetase